MRRNMPRDSAEVALLPQISATRSIVGAAIIPLKLTEQADFSMLRSEAGQGVAARFVYRGDSEGLAVVCVGSAPNLQIVSCRCQDCGSNAKTASRRRRFLDGGGRGESSQPCSDWRRGGQ